MRQSMERNRRIRAVLAWVAIACALATGTVVATPVSAIADTGLEAQATTTTPPKPTLSKATAGVGTITVTWKKQTTRTTGYEVQYAANKNFTSAKTASIGSNATTSKKLTGLGEAKTWWVRIRAVRKLNGKTYRSAWTAAKSATTTVAKPSATALKKLTPAVGAITVTWNTKTAASAKVQGYQLQYADNKDFASGKTATLMSVSASSKKITGLGEGKTWWVRIRTRRLVNGKAYYSAYSTAMSATTRVNMPVKTRLTSVTGGKNSLTVTWERQDSHVEGYMLQCNTDPSFPDDAVTTISGNATTSKKITALADGTQYWVRVRTWRKIDGKTYRSAWSAAMRATTNVATDQPLDTSTNEVEPWFTSMVSLTEPTPGKGTLEARWLKGEMDITGYQLQWATDSSFQGVKTAKVPGRDVTTKTITGLPTGVRAWVRVRVYKTYASGHTLYSSWSNSVSATPTAKLSAQAEETEDELGTDVSVTPQDSWEEPIIDEPIIEETDADDVVELPIEE